MTYLRSWVTVLGRAAAKKFPALCITRIGGISSPIANPSRFHGAEVRKSVGGYFAGVAQIGCNLTKEEAEKLARYAAETQLSRPSLCVLLIQRELRRPRLVGLKVRAPKPFGEGGFRRVTVHIIDPSLKGAFADHVKLCGMGSDDAAAMLFRAELKERWFFKTFGWNGNRP